MISFIPFESLMRLAAILFLALFLPAVPAYATEPCPDNSWYSHPQRPAAEWLKQAGLVFVGTLTARAENIVPYPNCYLEDKSKCAMLDKSKISVRIDRWEKGGVPGLKTIDLAAAYCAQDPPKEIGKT